MPKATVISWKSKRESSMSMTPGWNRDEEPKNIQKLNLRNEFYNFIYIFLFYFLNNIKLMI